MLRNISELEDCTIGAVDGEIGEVDDVYFDDRAWGVRYLVVSTGTWLAGRKVLISPFAIRRAEANSHVIDVSLTREQVKNSPSIETHEPVSRRHEEDYLGYYGYPAYWEGPYLWGLAALPLGFEERSARPVSSAEREVGELEQAQKEADSSLHSAGDVTGYGIEAADGSIGEVADFLFDDEAWAIRYLVIDTRKWWPGGKKVLIALQWVDGIDWVDGKVATRLTRDQIRKSPAYDDTNRLEREYEARLHEFYGKVGYWDDERAQASLEAMNRRAATESRERTRV